MLDVTNPKAFKQLSVVSFGTEAGPHSVHLTHDDKRLVVTDYFFLNEDDFGKVHLDGDHKVHVADDSRRRSLGSWARLGRRSRSRTASSAREPATVAGYRRRVPSRSDGPGTRLGL